MYVWQRGGRFTFQKRVPSDLVGLLGASPIRLALPPSGKRDAQRKATLLSGIAEAEFHRLRLGVAEEEDVRDRLIQELEGALEISEKLRGMQVDLARRGRLNEKAEEQAELEERLDGLRGSAEILRKTVSQVTPSGEAASDVHPDITAQLAQIQAQLATVAPNEGKVLPPLSEEYGRFVAAKRKELPKSKFSKYTLPAACEAFIEVVGDKPILDYRQKDLDEFAWVLSRVPANRAKIRRFAKLSYRKAGDENAKLKKPYPTLSDTTIRRQYLTPIKSVFEWLCVDHEVTSPFVNAKLNIPRTARSGEERHPLSHKQQAALLREAARYPRPDDKWLPLLGLLTGCRLAELVFLQGRDIKWNKEAGAWTFDLKETVLMKGRELPRPLKTPGSRRIIALPHILKELGFIDWARERPGFIFDQLHRRKRPADTASKRMNRLLRNSGIDGKGEVFHSLRHSHKDWLRDLDINDRTIDLQSGHALHGVAKKYGAKHLKPKEIKTLANCRLPEEVPIPEGLKVGRR